MQQIYRRTSMLKCDSHFKSLLGGCVCKNNKGKVNSFMLGWQRLDCCALTKMQLRKTRIWESTLWHTLSSIAMKPKLERKNIFEIPEKINGQRKSIYYQWPCLDILHVFYNLRKVSRKFHWWRAAFKRSNQRLSWR